MARYKALIKETWWLWLVLLGGGTLLTLKNPVFWATYPVCIFTFLWFGFVRYDEEGNFKGS